MSAGPDGSLGVIWPDLPTFCELAETRRVIPVVYKLLADAETPIGLYRKLTDGQPGTFLLESAETGVWARYSFIGVAAAAMLTSTADQATWIGDPPVGAPQHGNPLAVLERALAELHTPRLEGLPPFTGGFVGSLAYDIVRYWERLPDGNPDEIGIPDVMLGLTRDLAVLDHSDATLTLIANAINHDDSPDRVEQAHAAAVSRLRAMTARLSLPTPASAAVTHPGPTAAAVQRTTQQEYLDAVLAGKDAVRDGEVFQVVVSQRFSMPCPVDALEVYRVLRATNPSPYLYLFRGVQAGPDGARIPVDIVGSSPEALVKAEAGQIMSHPIAGTRPRGVKPEEDNDLAEDLLADVKERSEHLMLVDLARNDLSRVCDPASVHVVDFMSVERYSHVMHLVSTVTGEQRDSAGAIDVLRAIFPHGTLSGAPKPRAMELIDQLEPVRRGIYGGAVGYFDFAGNLDLAIAIRTAVVKNQMAHIQAGAGIVDESVPESEDTECHNKAAAVVAAVHVAQQLHPVT
ncbi:MAG: anthranilate synthase component I [Micrococcales bacterium]|nr:MAG: anthranilate synthase component I [Micrococcales bacterium]PIE27458.1 MAG: anthranilate synthase component I [Micrococcales bacterium]